MKRITILLPLLLSACGGHAGNYLIEASPAWVESTPTPVPPAPKGKKAKGTPTPALSPTPAVLKVFLAPFKDKRRNREIYRGRASYENVRVDVAGRTLLAKAWQDLYPGDISFLWHRELSAALGGSGYRLSAAAEPLSDEDALKAAKEAGADYLLQGDIRKLGITKKGADPLLGTNFGGTNYTFYSLHDVTLQSLSTGGKSEGEIAHERVYFNNVSLGAPNRDTFPQYFVRGLPEHARRVADDDMLRTAVGLPTCTVTPSPTSTPEPERHSTKTPVVRVVVATPTPIVDDSMYWYNPNTGKRVDPAWNFDPADGTPKKDFILRKK